MLPKFTFFALLASFAFGTAFAQPPSPKDKARVLAIMDRQESCWNKGDIEGFMNGYWESESLKFIGKKGVTYGYEATLARYKKNYPNTASMGKLSFDILHVEKISKKAIMVVGKWHLQRAEDAPQGHFTLMWKKIAGDWVIVADHSS